eukprot:283885-Amphidinium_carterae.2
MDTALAYGTRDCGFKSHWGTNTGSDSLQTVGSENERLETRSGVKMNASKKVGGENERLKKVGGENERSKKVRVCSTLAQPSATLASNSSIVCLLAYSSMAQSTLLGFGVLTNKKREQPDPSEAEKRHREGM